jgi:hypothetical protein
MTDDDTTTAWANGITVKRTTSGYSWTIAVAADNSDLEALRAATATARRIDAELTDVYGPPKQPAAGREGPRVHVPQRHDAGEAPAEGGTT